MKQRFYPKRCSSSSISAETVCDIDELLSEILLRVPARPLVRFKCVSKHWLSLISDPKFCHRHTLRNPRSSISAVFPILSTVFSVIPLDLDRYRNTNHANQNLSDSAGSVSPDCNPLNFIPHLDEIRVIQSCNGLFLCSPLTMSATTFYVLNPTTNQFSTLTLPADAVAATSSPPCILLGYALAFDPSKSPHYKVFFLQTITERIVGEKYCSYYHIHIYSSENRSWRLLSSSFFRLPNVDYEKGVYCNGAVHWVGLDNEITYYHIDDERVRNVYYPPTPIRCEYRKFRYFQESCCGSHLYLIDIYVSEFTRFEVLEMRRDYSGWFLKYHVDLDPQLTGFPWLGWYHFIVLFLFPEEVEGEESLSLLLHCPGKVISYNFKSKIFKSFDLLPRPGVNDSILRTYKQSHRYMETLACV